MDFVAHTPAAVPGGGLQFLAVLGRFGPGGIHTEILYILLQAGGRRGLFERSWCPTSQETTGKQQSGTQVQPARQALRSVSLPGAGTTSTIWLRARSSASAKAIGKTEVRRFTSSCKS